jgi:hypothetical protein
MNVNQQSKEIILLFARFCLEPVLKKVAGSIILLVEIERIPKKQTMQDPR